LFAFEFFFVTLLEEFLFYTEFPLTYYAQSFPDKKEGKNLEHFPSPRWLGKNCQKNRTKFLFYIILAFITLESFQPETIHQLFFAWIVEAVPVSLRKNDATPTPVPIF
jgi:hypothetical protein